MPLPGVAERIISRYLVPGGIKAGQPFRPVPRLGLHPIAASTELSVAGNFVEVYLAREGHDGGAGVNYLEKSSSLRRPRCTGRCSPEWITS